MREERWLPQTDSTNRWLKEHGAELPDGSMCCTLRQTAGRGRRGRSWDAVDGEALAMSLLIRPAVDGGAAPLALGLAAARTLRAATGLELQIKWPNDIVCNGLKVCGILCELAGEFPDNFIVAGIGINLSQSPDTLHSAGLDNAASLAMLAGPAGCAVSPKKVAHAIADKFAALCAALRAEGFSPLRTKYVALCATLGNDVRVLGADGHVRLEGQAVGIDEAGCLLVQTAGGLQAVSAGEVSVRRADGRYV